MKTKTVIGVSVDEGDSPSAAKTSVSSLIDISFLLLIYFLVTSTLLPKEGDLFLALQGAPGDLSYRPIEPDPIHVRLDDAGVVYIEKEAIGYGDEAARRLFSDLQGYRALCYALDNEPAVHLDADGGADHQQFISILNEVARAGITDLRILDIHPSD